jgi:hypothetical protein
MYSFEAACRNVLRLLGHLEIIEPAELRQYVKEKVVKLHALYV